MIAVTFDYGQTLAALDLNLLSERVADRGVGVEVDRLQTASPAAWAAYNDAKRAGAEGEVAWRTFMTQLLSGAGARVAQDSQLEEIVGFLWSQQPKHNLWRSPIEGMFELCARLNEAEIPVGIISNSEGRLAELVDELGYRHLFRTIADSGVLGFEKPDRRIFDWAAERLGVEASGLIHVGDAWEADVKGVRGAGGRAIFFTDETGVRPRDERIRVAHTAGDVVAALHAWGVPAIPADGENQC